MHEEQFKPQLIHQARIHAGQKALDLGCGTATLTILIKQSHPEAEITGLDGDVKVLAIGRAKATKAGVKLTWIRDCPLSFHTRTNPLTGCFRASSFIT